MNKLMHHQELAAIRQIVQEIGGKTQRKCYTMLHHAVQLSLKAYPQRLQMKVIKLEIIQQTGESVIPDAASRALARAADDIWNSGCRDKLEALYGHPLSEKPTPLSIIYAISDHIVAKGTDQ